MGELKSSGHPLAWSLGVANAALLLAQIGADGRFRWEQIGLLMAFTAGHLLLWTYLSRSGGGIADPLLLAAISALTGIGLAVLYRIDASLGYRQLLWLFIGLSAFGWLAHAPIWPALARRPFAWAGAGLAFLLATVAFGVEVGGARSWIRLGVLGFQPVEFVKPFMIIFLAGHLAAPRRGGEPPPTQSASSVTRLPHWAPPALVALVSTSLLAAQRDLGAASLLLALFVTMLFVATGRIVYLAAGAGVMLMAAGAATMLFDHVRVRMLVWLDPWAYIDTSGFQLVESMFALSGGGLLGSGWGSGMAHRIPVVETDFIFPLIAEELGLAGAGALLFLLAFVSVRALAAAATDRLDDVQRLASAGIGLLIALQSALIVGGVTRLLPVTGVTLPFVSYGGSSLVACLAQLGLVYNAHRSIAASDERSTQVGVA